MSNNEGHPIIRLHHVCKSYSVGELDVPILDDVTLDIDEGTITAVFGVSGTGKTTLLNLIGGLDRPDSGRITVDGEELSGKTESMLTDFRRRKMGFVFQFYNLFPSLKASENVEAAVELLGLDRQTRRKRVQQCLAGVGLQEKSGQFPDQLSGGEQQRVAIARAMAKEPRILLADEPTGNLDQESGTKVWDLFREMNQISNTTMVIVSHSPQVKRIAHRVVTLERRRIVDVA